MGILNLSVLQNRLNTLSEVHNCLNDSIKNIRIIQHQQKAEILRLQMDLKRAKAHHKEKPKMTFARQVSATVN